ncbi:MAG: tetratricopeptide repeat protein [Pseudomonadales bacterium]
MLPASVLLIFFSALLAAGHIDAFERSHSIDPRVDPPTAYGLNMVRPEHRQIIDARVYEAPADHAINMEPLAAEIARLEAEAGPYTAQLTQPLMDLGVAYRNRGHAQQAIDVLKRAMHVLRINHGLDTPLQIPLLGQLIDSHLALGHYKEADKKHSALYNLKLRIYQEEDPLRHIATEHFADWQRNAYLAELGKKKFNRLLGIHNMYSSLTEAQATRIGKTDAALVPLLYKQMQAEYLILLYDGEKKDEIAINSSQPGGEDAVRVPSQAEMQFLMLQKNNFRNGKQALRRILEIHEHNPDTPASDIAKAKIALGDWHIWFGKPVIARHRYEEAFELLAASKDSDALIEECFGKPLELPISSVFQPGIIAPRAKHKGEVVMRFAVTNYGQARKIKTIISDPAMKETDAGRRTYKMLKRVRFRPRMEAGKVVSTEGLERKYYVSY